MFGKGLLGNTQQIGGESKAQLAEQIKACLRSGHYSRAIELLRGAAAEFPADADLAKLEKQAQDGVQRNAEAQRLITESQELFAQQKAAEAIQLLRQAFELDKNNSLARAILANALVEQAQFLVETDWLEAEKLTNQALAVNPAHPTAKTIFNLIVDKKKTSLAEDWVSQASRLHSAGDLFGALAWVAEGLAVHPNDAKLLQIQEAIQRDQSARRRQTRRRDLDELRRMEREIDGTAGVAAKQALAERIQGIAAKYWTDGEFLSIANGLLQRLGLAESPTVRARSKGSAVIFHVPRPGAGSSSAAKMSSADSGQSPAGLVRAGKDSAAEGSQSNAGQGALPSGDVPAENAANAVAEPGVASSSVVASSIVASGVQSDVARKTVEKKILTPPPARNARAQATIVPAAVAVSAAAVEVRSGAPRENQSQANQIEGTHTQAKQVGENQAEANRAKLKQPARARSTTLIIVSIGLTAVIVLASIFFFMRKGYAPKVAKAPTAAAIVSPPAPTSPKISGPGDSAQSASVLGPTASTPPQPTTEPSEHAVGSSSDTVAEKVAPAQPSGPRLNANERALAESSQKPGSLQKTHSGEGEARVSLNFAPKPQFAAKPQAKPLLASLTIQGGAAGTAVFVDQTLAGAVQSDGSFSIAAVSPGDHVVELRKDRFKPRQFKEHFVAGGAISLVAADAALEAAPGQLKITFTPADARVAIVKDQQQTMVSSGTPLSLAPGTYTLTARTADRFTRSSTVEVVAGESKVLDLSLAATGMSKWDDPSGWKPEKDSFIRKGGDFVLYGAAPAAGTFMFSAMPGKGHLLQWIVNYTDARNYVLFQMDDNYFYRAVIRNGVKTDEIRVPDKGDKKSLRTLIVRVSPTEIVHQVKHGDASTILDRWTQPGTNLSQGKFGFYVPGNDEVTLSNFSHYPDLNIR